MSASAGGATGTYGPRGIWCNGNVTATDAYRLSTNVWSHVLVTKTGTSLKIYVNGTQVASGTASTGLPTSTGALLLGENGTAHFAGLIDEVKIYDHALTTTEIQQNMDRPADPGNVSPTIPAPLSGLKAAYGFEGHSSWMNDSSGNGNHGTMDLRGPGRSGGALAPEVLASVPDSNSLDVSSGMTAEVWLNPDPAATSTFLFPGAILEKTDAYLLQTLPASNTVQFGIYLTNGVYHFVNATVTPYQASHIAGTYDGTTMRIYVDGVQKATKAVTGAVRTNTSDLIMGDYYAQFKETIDEVRIYDRALTATEVGQDLQNPIAAPYIRPPTPTSLPAATTGYDSATGLPTTVSTTENSVTRTVTTGYDTVGRVTSYTDAEGNASSATYDLLGRPTTVNDGKGTQTFTYDATTGLPTQVVDSHAGTFTATYGPGDELTSEVLPNGLRADTIYSEDEAATDLTYTKQSCSSNCLWYDEHVKRSIHGEWLRRDSSLSDQDYVYDHLSRLTQVKDTPTGQGCTTRSYTYDANSNRTSMTTRAPGAGGICDTTSPGTVQSSSYDSADRLVNDGFTYDAYSRVTRIPASHAGGTALSTSYYLNDMVKTQTQGVLSKGWLLDPTQGRYRASIPSGTSQEVMHYADGSDTPAWTEMQTSGATVSWDRNISGLGGGIAAIASNNGTTTTTQLQIPNLHGDIVATADKNPAVTALLSTFESDEFGNPRVASSRKYGWLGSAGRRSMLDSGVIQMGARSYVPAMGRFTTVDPVAGGSANDYDYANADPVNGFDLDGLRARSLSKPKCHAYHGSAERRGVAGNMQARIDQTIEWCVRDGVIISKKAYKPTYDTGPGWRAVGRWTRDGGGGKGHTYYHAISSLSFKFCVNTPKIGPIPAVKGCPFHETLTIDVYLYSNGTFKLGPSQTT
jgi:RHS repeat-associated protein